MDKFDFIDWLLRFYNVSDTIFQNELTKYSNGLLGGLDYEGLKGFITETCKNRPSVIEINKFATTYKFFKKEEYKCPALIHWEFIKRTAYKGTMNDLPEETKNKILAFTQKMGIKSCLEN